MNAAPPALVTVMTTVHFAPEFGRWPESRPPALKYQHWHFAAFEKTDPDQFTQ